MAGEFESQVGNIDTLWGKTWLLVTMNHIVQYKSLNLYLIELPLGQLIGTLLSLIAVATMVW